MIFRKTMRLAVNGISHLRNVTMRKPAGEYESANRIIRESGILPADTLTALCASLAIRNKKGASEEAQIPSVIMLKGQTHRACMTEPINLNIKH